MFFGKRIRSVFCAPSRSAVGRFLARHGLLAAAAITTLGFAGCAQNPQQLVASHHPKEYFPASIYGPASRRVIPDGQPIPRGGGQYLVGKPYTIAGQTYYPSERKITQVGYASWYGDAFHGRLTANGEIYDRDGLTAAHPTMPLPSYARVTNLRNHYSMIVRVNDRGPYHSNRVMDVSRRVAEALEFARGGTSKIKVEYVGRASLAGSDDAKLYATLRMDGPASPAGIEGGTMFAEAAPARVASREDETPVAAERPERIVEDQRPDALALYRAPHPHHPSAERAQREVASRDDDEEEPTPRPAERPAPSLRRPTQRMAETEMPRMAYGEPSRPRSTTRVARLSPERSTSAEARAFALHELAPMPVRRAAESRLGPASRQMRDASSEAAVMPPRRVRVAAASPVPHHAPAGFRSTHSRVD